MVIWIREPDDCRIAINDVSGDAQVLQYAAEYKDLDEPLRDFIKRKGVINKCAARFAQRLGRGGKVAQQVSSDEVAALHTERQ